MAFPPICRFFHKRPHSWTSLYILVVVAVVVVCTGLFPGSISKAGYEHTLSLDDHLEGVGNFPNALFDPFLCRHNCSALRFRIHQAKNRILDHLGCRPAEFSGVVVIKVGCQDDTLTKLVVNIFV